MMMDIFLDSVKFFFGAIRIQKTQRFAAVKDLLGSLLIARQSLPAGRYRS
jgi:hypothetical protein